MAQVEQPPVQILVDAILRPLHRELVPAHVVDALERQDDVVGEDHGDAACEHDLVKSVAPVAEALRDEAEKHGGNGEYVINEITQYLNDEGVDIDNIELNWLFNTEVGETNGE